MFILTAGKHIGALSAEDIVVSMVGGYGQRACFTHRMTPWRLICSVAKQPLPNLSQGQTAVVECKGIGKPHHADNQAFSTGYFLGAAPLSHGAPRLLVARAMPISRRSTRPTTRFSVSCLSDASGPPGSLFPCMAKHSCTAACYVAPARRRAKREACHAGKQGSRNQEDASSNDTARRGFPDLAWGAGLFHEELRLDGGIKEIKGGFSATVTLGVALRRPMPFAQGASCSLVPWRHLQLGRPDAPKRMTFCATMPASLPLDITVRVPLPFCVRRRAAPLAMDAHKHEGVRARQLANTSKPVDIT